MPEYDAFGREIGENTLQGLGGDPRPAARPSEAAGGRRRRGGRAQAAARRRPAGRAAAADGRRPPPAPPAPPPTRSRGTARGAARDRLPVLADLPRPVLGVIGIAAAGFFGAAKDAIDDVTDSLDSPALPDLQRRPPRRTRRPGSAATR